MRGTATWLLVGALAALGVAAGADALRSLGGPDRGASEPPAETAPEAEPEPVGDALADARAELRSAGVPAGILTYSDETCRLRSVTLPDLAPHPGSREERCTFGSMVGSEFASGGPPPYPFGSLAALCRGEEVELRLPNRGLFARARGSCPLVWRPDGTPTFLRDGEVMRFASCSGKGALPLRCSRTLLSRNDLTRELRRARWSASDFRVEEFHWLSDRGLLAIVRAGGVDGGALLAVFDRRRLVSSPPFAYEGLTDLRPSPSGALITARIESPGGLLVIDRRGRPVRLALRHGHALAWSPDERWIAEATADGVYLFRAHEPSPEFLHIPIAALDLVWR